MRDEHLGHAVGEERLLGVGTEVRKRQNGNPDDGHRCDAPPIAWGHKPAPKIVGGGGGNRTRVRKGSYESFYTLSTARFSRKTLG